VPVVAAQVARMVLAQQVVLTPPVHLVAEVAAGQMAAVPVPLPMQISLMAVLAVIIV